jgi:hypothetical protein
MPARSRPRPWPGSKGGIRRNEVIDWFGIHHGAVALVIYLTASVILWRHVVAHLGGVCLCDGSADPAAFMWALVWYPHAIGHGINPVVSHVIWVPGGLDLARVASVPGAALAATPLTEIAGPVVAYNILSLLSPVLAAWFAYRLCLYMTRSPASSILAGYLFGFSSYELGQLIGHLNLIFTFAIPAVALLTLQRIDGRVGTRRYVVLMTLLLTAQLLLSTEILFTLTCMGIVTLAAAWLWAGADDRRRIIGVLPPLLVAYALMLAICSPFLYYALFTGKAYSQGYGAGYPADALNFVIPTTITRIGGRNFAAVSSGFLGNLAENGAYLGLPALVIVAVWAAGHWRVRLGKILLSVLVVAIVWSLGDRLTIAGHPTIRLPWWVLSKLPFLDQLLPVRVSVYVTLICAVIVALWLSADGGRRWHRWALALVAVALLIPNAAIRTYAPLYQAPISAPRFFTTDAYRQYLRRGETVLPIPYAWTGLSMLWQARTRMYFRLASGYFGPAPPSYAREPLLPELIANSPGPDAGAQLRSFVVRRRVSAVVVDNSQSGPWAAVLTRLHLRGVSVGGVTVYRVPPGWSASGVPAGA